MFFRLLTWLRKASVRASMQFDQTTDLTDEIAAARDALQEAQRRADDNSDRLALLEAKKRMMSHERRARL